MITDYNAASDDTTASYKLLESLKPQYESLVNNYKKSWQLTCMLADIHGNVITGDSGCSDSRDGFDCTFTRRRAIDEALRWGEPSMLLCPSGHVMWAVPVMHNSSALGGIIVESVIVSTLDGDRASMSPADIRKAASDLLTLAEEANLTNAAFLELKRNAARRESERAEAIHELKEHNYQSIRDIYLVEEPVLIAAIKRGDRPAAREIINRVLAGIYYMGRERPTLLKSFVLELIVTMSRSAVEAGADPSELLGANYSSFAELAMIDTEEELCVWLVSMLERMMDAIKSNHQYPSSVLLGAALKYMQDNLHEDLTRDDVANVACLSPSHFSRVVKQTFSHSFTDLLAKMRVEKARELLTITEKSLIQICLECGFSDQSYFTKVFQKYTGRTPGEYRRSKKTSLK
ncbi:MAG: helix-turn-helix domain-containing protein [Armatimonadota bacterium]